MVSEKGCIVSECVMSEEIQKKFSHKLYIASVISLVIGSVGLAAYLVTSVSYDFIYDFIPEWCNAFLLFAVPFGFGLVFLLTLKSQIKNSRKLEGIKNVYEFYSDCILARELRGGLQTGVVRFTYDNIVKTKDDEDMLYFYYQVKTLAYPLEKNSLTPAELNTVKKLLGMPVGADEELLELAPCKEWNGGA